MIFISLSGKKNYIEVDQTQFAILKYLLCSSISACILRKPDFEKLTASYLY